MARSPQSRFLHSARGRRARSARCSGTRDARPKQQALDRGVERLLDPGEMGTLFKVAALVSPGLAAAAGFEQALHDTALER